MAYYDLEEQEQLDTLKAWWKQWGLLCLLGLALALAALAAYQGWRWYQGQQAAKASELYAAASKSAQAGDSKQARATIATLVERHSSSGYAALGSLVAARLSFEAGDLAAAKRSLQWVLDHGRDPELKAVARYRLASALFDEKAFDEALKLLDAKPEDPMANLYFDLRGDIFTAKGAEAEARAAYQTALEKTDAASPYRNLIQIKIDALGRTGK
ncbi:MAG: tetratricopeptide repeat protein [Burkholderiales bacterium]|nr:tetratricopeptide repeat protein [Burkholderiales bacterium]